MLERVFGGDAPRAVQAHAFAHQVDGLEQRLVGRVPGQVIFLFSPTGTAGLVPCR